MTAEDAVLALCRLTLAGWDFGERWCDKYFGEAVRAPANGCRCRTCEAVRAVAAIKEFVDQQSENRP